MDAEDFALIMLELLGGAFDFTNARETGKHRRELFEFNASLADDAAVDALERGERDVSLNRMGIRQLIGSQRAAIAGNNVDVNTGSARDFQENTAFLGELDSDTIRANAARESEGFALEAFNLREQGKLAEKTGRNEGFNTILTSGSNVLRIAKGA